MDKPTLRDVMRPYVRKCNYFTPDDYKGAETVKGRSMADQTKYIPTDKLVNRIRKGEVVYHDQQLDLGDPIEDKDVDPVNMNPLDMRGNDDLVDLKRVADEARDINQAAAKYSKNAKKFKEPEDVKSDQPKPAEGGSPAPEGQVEPTK